MAVFEIEIGGKVYEDRHVRNGVRGRFAELLSKAIDRHALDQQLVVVGDVVGEDRRAEGVRPALERGCEPARSRSSHAGSHAALLRSRQHWGPDARAGGRRRRPSVQRA